ncbi:MAG: NUDIX domain-containing protein [Patescibacteria group bacterium]
MNQWAGAILVTKDNNIILQKRDDTPGIFNPGKITLFGGGVEQGEKIKDAVIRELLEETGLSISKDQLEPFGSYQKTLAKHGDECLCHVFIVDNVIQDDIIVYEGQGFVSTNKKTPVSTDTHSALTVEILNDYYKR